MNLNDIKHIHFIGVGGIGMSALARYFVHIGKIVSGYDKTRTELTDLLVNEGIEVHFEDNIDLIPSNTDLVVFTPAIPSNHQQLNHCKAQNLPLYKRSEVLGLITQSKKTIAVAGSHGKTTISAMVTYVLRACGVDCSAFLGGVALDFDSNYVAGNSEYVVVEADEFDRSFHRLSPDYIIISSVDSDHLDIYGSKEGVKEAFVQFTEQLDENGKIIVQAEVETEGFDKDKLKTYALNQKADFQGNKIGDEIDFKIDGVTKGTFELDYGGLHNIENSLSALAIVETLGLDLQKALKAIKYFKGIKRRYQKIILNEYQVFIDDYAHHPTELNALVESLKEKYPNKEMCLVFQPHLFTRTQDFAAEFAAALDKVDYPILLPIYPAREQPIEGVTSQLILDKMKNPNKLLLSKEAVLDRIKETKPKFFVTAGAGNIDKLVEPLKGILTNNE